MGLDGDLSSGDENDNNSFDNHNSSFEKSKGHKAGRRLS